MKHIVLLGTLVPMFCFAQNNQCDEYFTNADRYIGIMSNYSNDSKQILELKNKFKSSKEALEKIKGEEKNMVCENMNKDLLVLIEKYKNK
ncbi:DUF5339 domain-containing protein [Enterobacter kobei]|uniref:DUF5339 domain-containing protein n=1 Tax=Enterobacter kobei TaxID=208224 RepID=UPI0021C142A6|nr:DUF5339 domain-containing protein [Enterobacter kobei]UXJ66649.1 DUF5339 domain-containing protein [Enterobacter kobei]